MMRKKEHLFIGFYRKSVLLTYMGVASAIIGIHFAFLKHIDFALICLLISGICDAFDGRIARACKRSDEEKRFGVELDSLADIVSFVLFPIIIFYNLNFARWYNLIIFVIFALNGVIRLAYFNIQAGEGLEPVKCYRGLPVTTTSFIFPILYLLFHNNRSFELIYTVFMFGIAILFILNFPLKKPQSKFVYFCLIIAIILVALLLGKALFFLPTTRELAVILAALLLGKA